MGGDVFVEILHKISVSVDVQRLKIAHDVVEKTVAGEEFRN